MGRRKASPHADPTNLTGDHCDDGKAVTYIRASGTVYLAAGNPRLRAWLRRDG
jgi:hypothetical protein